MSPVSVYGKLFHVVHNFNDDPRFVRYEFIENDIIRLEFKNLRFSDIGATIWIYWINDTIVVHASIRNDYQDMIDSYKQWRGSSLYDGVLLADDAINVYVKRHESVKHTHIINIINDILRKFARK